MQRLGSRRAIIGPIFVHDIVELLFVLDFNRLNSTDQAGHSLHHVHLDMAMKQEIAANFHMLFVFFLFVRMAAILAFGQPDHVGDNGFGNERFRRAKAARIDDLIAPVPACWVWKAPTRRCELKTYQRIRLPASQTMVGVLPTNVRPFKHIDSRLPDEDSVTVCGIVPAWVQVTVPPGPTVTVLGSKRGLPGVSRIVTAAVAGPPVATTT
jgi:hypothetical protein